MKCLPMLRAPCADSFPRLDARGTGNRDSVDCPAVSIAQPVDPPGNARAQLWLKVALSERTVILRLLHLCISW